VIGTRVVFFYLFANLENKYLKAFHSVNFFADFHSPTEVQPPQ